MKPKTLTLILILGSLILSQGWAQVSVRPLLNQAYDYLDNGKTESSIDLLEAEIPSLKKYSDEDKVSFWNTLAYIHHNEGHFNDSRPYYEKALSQHRQSGPLTIKVIQNIVSPLANLLTRLGEYEKAQYLFQEAIFFLQEDSTQVRLQAELMLSLGIIYRTTEKYKEALAMNDSAWQFLNRRDPKEHLRERGNILVNKADIQERMKDYSNCRATIQEAQALLMGKTELLDLLASITAISANLEVSLGNTKTALGQYQKAITLYERFSSNTSINQDERQIAKIHIAIGQISDSLQNYYTALEAFHLALCAAIPDLDETDLEALPADKQLYADNTILDALRGKAKVFKDTDRTSLALASYEKASTTLFVLLEDLQAQSSKQHLTDYAFDIFDQSMSLLFEKNQDQDDTNWHSEVLAVIESSKAMQLHDWLSVMDQLKSSGLSKRLLQAEHDYRIAYLEKEQLFFLLLDSPQADKEEINKMAGELYQARDRYDSLKAEILPKSTTKNSNTASISPQEFQNMLDPASACISYFLGDKKAYVHILKKRESSVHQLSLPADFADQIDDLRAAIYNTRPDQHQISHEIYQLILAPVASKLANVNKLLIIPDGQLIGVPFEALVVQSRPQQQPLYLIQEFDISYNFSVTWFLKQKEDQHQGVSSYKNPLLAVALDMPEVRALNHEKKCAFPFIKELVDGGKKIAALMGGEALFGRRATEKNFFAQADQYHMLHISSHGIVNTGSPNLSYLAFYEPDTALQICEQVGACYVSDILGKSLSADLVFMEACETAYEKDLVFRGEGALSLSRAFAHTGTKSIVSTLWPVSKTTESNQLVDLFYQQIKMGKPKDEALSAAKRQLIKEKGRYATPHYWAGYVLIGDTSPISYYNSWVYSWDRYKAIGLILVMILLITGIFVNRKKFSFRHK